MPAIASLIQVINIPLATVLRCGMLGWSASSKGYFFASTKSPDGGPGLSLANREEGVRKAAPAPLVLPFVSPAGMAAIVALSRLGNRTVAGALNVGEEHD